MVWGDYLRYKLIDDVVGHIFDIPLNFGALATHDCLSVKYPFDLVNQLPFRKTLNNAVRYNMRNEFSSDRLDFVLKETLEQWHVDFCAVRYWGVIWNRVILLDRLLPLLRFPFELFPKVCRFSIFRL